MYVSVQCLFKTGKKQEPVILFKDVCFVKIKNNIIINDESNTFGNVY